MYDSKKKSSISFRKIQIFCWKYSTTFLTKWKAELAEPFKGQIDFVSTQCLAGAWKST